MNSELIVFGVGFLAQGFFSARIMVQWILSERARRVLSPTVFWVLSLAGSWLLCLYGWLRADFAIVLGQVIAYYIYLWNLDLKGQWFKIPFIVRLLLIITPVAVLSMLLMDAEVVSQMFFHNSDVPLWLLLYGSAGQLLFTLRFVYQWYCSRRCGASVLPAGFWFLSLVGALLIVSYGIVRRDPVLIVGQSFGLVAYTRNIIIGRKHSESMSKPKFSVH